MLQPKKSQNDRFRKAAGELEYVEDKARWEEKLRKVVSQKLAPEKSK